jgi:hypothetical protein
MKLSPKDDDRLWREPEKTSWFRFSSPLRYIVFLILLIALLVGLWYLIAPSHRGYNKADLALILPDEAPYKVRPENPGVTSVKHQDKLVYGRIRADQNSPVAEHILPDPETPLPQIKEDSVTIKMVEQYAPEDLDPEKTLEIIENEPKKEVSIEDLIEETSEEKKEPEKVTIKGKTFIQLGSLKSYDLAESEWERLSKKHGDVLGKLKPVIQKVDLGEEQGIYYRLRTGPFESGNAKAVCHSLNEKKVGCIVIH